MKLDRLTAALITLALASLCAAQRLSAQNLISCSDPQTGTDVLLGTTASSSNCPVSSTVSLGNDSKPVSDTEGKAVLSHSVIAAP